MNIPFYIVDVFAEEKYAGNQLAVITEGRYIDPLLMQKIAREINFSETTFITSGAEVKDVFDVRIFTPREEVPFAGHPVLGTAYVIQKEILKAPERRLHLNLQSGHIAVLTNYLENNEIDIIWMRQNPPTFGKTFSPEEILPLLGLHRDDLDLNFPIQEVSTGLPALITPLKSLDALRKAKVDLGIYNKFVESGNPRAIFIFTPETYLEEDDLAARMFAPAYGIAEDPATGSANGCLCGYLLKYNYYKKDRFCVSVEQGYEVDRPSKLFLKGEEEHGKIIIYVGGRVRPVARGELFIDMPA